MVILRVFLLILLNISISYAEPQRIISISPEVTETLFYLGLENKIIAVSDYCKWPPKVNEKIRIGGMLNPSFEKILSLNPDLVILSKNGTPFEVYQRLKDFGLNIYVFNPTSIFDLPREISKLGEYLGKIDKAKIVIENYNSNLLKFKNFFNGQKAIFIVWTENMTVASEKSHIGEIINFLGFKNIVKNSSPYVQINLEEIIRENPDFIFIGTGHENNSTIQVLEKLKNTSAVRNGKVLFVSDKIYHLSPRIIEGIKELINGKDNHNISRKP